MRELEEKTRLREKLADLEHQQWAHWTKYMLDNLTPENIERWKKQCDTNYEDLTEKEKDSDREWAHKVIELLDEEQIREAKIIMEKLGSHSSSVS